jgi:hypothetical protein
MHFNVLGLNNVLVGDLATLKYILSNPDVQNRGQ